MSKNALAQLKMTDLIHLKDGTLLHTEDKCGRFNRKRRNRRDKKMNNFMRTNLSDTFKIFTKRLRF